MDGSSRTTGRWDRPTALLLLVSPLRLLAGCATDATPTERAGEPFAVEVVDFQPGEGAGFGQDRFPEVVLGPPRGGGERAGSLDVLSLGRGGAIVLRLGRAAVDGPGPDLLVFENPFRYPGGAFVEPGEVSVSADGEVWRTFPCDPSAPETTDCAGVAPVLANAETNELDPTDPEQAGGDAFDLADVGLEAARFVRIVDVGVGPGFGPPSEGFDLDALAVVTRP